MEPSQLFLWSLPGNAVIEVELLPENSCLIPLGFGKTAGRVQVLIPGTPAAQMVRSYRGKEKPEERQARLASMNIVSGPLSQALERSYIATLFQLVRSVDSCDPSTIRHASRTQVWSRRLANELGCSQREVRWIALAAHLHDVGKILVPFEISTKPGQLVEEEWVVMKRHSAFGAALLRRSERLRPAADMVHYHHEHVNGKGYPDGLTGDRIPLGARIICVADAYTTMTDGRIYRPAVSRSAAAGELSRCSGSQFDPIVVDSMLRLLQQPEYQVG
jgi:HD-GYP domain-containing protein (c-di-GMP phosphodiesterase class II)